MRLFKRLPVGFIAASLAFCVLVPCMGRAQTKDERFSLPGLLMQGTLDPPLLGRFSNLKFSPDGNYILAQDSSRIFVLTRQPLAVHFRIDSMDAEPAEFAPDSSEVVFSIGGSQPSVERWSVLSGQKISGKSLTLARSCLTGRLSPDARTFACFSQHRINVLPPGLPAGLGDDCCSRNVSDSRPGWWGLYSGPADFGQEVDFQLIDVGSGDVLARKSPFTLLGPVLGAPMFHASFSPDGRYFIAALRKDVFALDVTLRKFISLGGGLDQMLGAGFAFLASDQVIVENQPDRSRSEILDFPSGSLIRTLPLGNEQVEGVTRGNYTIFRPTNAAPVRVLDSQSAQVVMALPGSTAVDIWERNMVSQSSDGEIALSDIGASRGKAN